MCRISIMASLSTSNCSTVSPWRHAILDDECEHCHYAP